jgi:hypothetical protein
VTFWLVQSAAPWSFAKYLSSEIVRSPAGQTLAPLIACSALSREMYDPALESDLPASPRSKRAMSARSGCNHPRPAEALGSAECCHAHPTQDSSWECSSGESGVEALPAKRNQEWTISPALNFTVTERGKTTFSFRPSWQRRSFTLPSLEARALLHSSCLRALTIVMAPTLSQQRSRSDRQSPRCGAIDG